VSPRDHATLDRRTLNRALLARQLLLERNEAEPLDVVERLVGMQAQVPLDPYVGLWSRLRAFDPDTLGRALLERRAVRMTLMRSTLHLVSSADAWRIRPLLQGMLDRAFAASPFARNLHGLDLAAVVARGRELVEAEPMTIARLRDALGDEWPDCDANSLAYAVRYLIPLVQVTPRGVWGATMQPTVTTLDRWLGRTEVAPSTLEELILRYLRAFGPATAADIRAWSSLGDVRMIVDRLRSRLGIYRDEAGRELFDVANGLFVDPETPAPVRFLPEYDNLFLSHDDRSRIMDVVRWGTSFTHRGCFFVDGFLAGAWKLTKQKRQATLVVEHRRQLGVPDRRQVAREAEELLAFLVPEGGRRLELTRG
jgi:hypothetical protein